MLVADLRNKLTLRELISEDFLTSCVFSTFRYLEQEWLERFLTQAVNLEGKTFRAEIEDPIYEFWPWYPPTPPLKKAVQPDLVILSGETAVIIEAKNYSGKSGVTIISDAPEQLPEGENNKEIIDQLGREYVAGVKRLLNSFYHQEGKLTLIKSFALVFVTRHNLFPRAEIEETIEAIREVLPEECEDAEKRIFWINWQKVMPLLREILEVKSRKSFEHKIASDLLEFLERRGLWAFSGFGFLRKSEAFHELPSDHLFYHKLFAKYWSFLDHFNAFPAIEEGRCFYSKTCVPYWSYLEKQLGFNFVGESFYGGKNLWSKKERH